MEPPPEVYQRAMVSRGPGGLLARPVAPAEYAGMFSREELAQATPGRVQSLLGRLIGESPQNIMRMNLDEAAQRKAGVLDYQSKKRTADDAEKERKGLAEVQAAMPPAPDPSDYAATLAWNRGFISRLMSKGLIKQAYQMSQYLDTEPPKQTSASPVSNLSWIPDTTAPGGYRQLGSPQKPSTEMTPYQRESIRLQEMRLRLSRQGASGGVKAPRPPTEAQEKSHIFYNLMATSAPEIDALVAGGNVRPDMITLALRSGPFDFAANRMLNDDEQKLLRAARDFTAGVLRKESGAAIKNDEILNTFQRYITLSGEGDAVAGAKKSARANYMKTMERSALPALNYYRAMEGAVPMEDPDHPEATGTMVPVPKTGKPHTRY
jgi:hypothetical protein